MAENPYKAPESVGPTIVAGAHRTAGPYHWYIALAAAAVIEGVASYRLFDGKPPEKIATVLFFATPAIAILYSAFFALSYSGSLSAKKSASQLLGATVLAFFVAAAGYVCFATTCCCTNLVAGTVVLEGAPPVVWACLVGGVISAVTMVLSCLLVTAVVP